MVNVRLGFCVENRSRSFGLKWSECEIYNGSENMRECDFGEGKKVKRK